MRSRTSRFAAAVALGVASVLLFLVTARPPGTQWRVTKAFIPKGSGFPEIEKILEGKGLLRYPLAFRILVIGTMTGTKLQHGEYVFPAPPSALELWEKIVGGDVAKYQMTIPDGSTIHDIAGILENLELADSGAFLAAATSPGMAMRAGIEGTTVEGYLFPDTYTLVKDMTTEEILGVMIRRFRRKFTPEMEKRAREDGFTVHQIVTIASIIEKETGVEEEKPLVSAVIRKRLSVKMPLQMDPTVIYGMKKFDGNLTKKDLRSPHPYNTYVNPGLPPGPIANPGFTSLKAAVFPADADYLYFVSRNDGSHQFSRTLREHNKAVSVYQRRKDANVARVDVAEEARSSKAAAPAPTPPLRQ